VITDAELAALGPYYPDGPFAEDRLQLLTYLIDEGATVEELVAYREELPGLAMVVALRGGGALPSQAMKIVSLPKASSPYAGCSLSPRHFSAKRRCSNSWRVMGAAMARVADAPVSSFIANVEPAARLSDPVGLVRLVRSRCAGSTRWSSVACVPPPPPPRSDPTEHMFG
jgi:hypothetical protein